MANINTITIQELKEDKLCVPYWAQDLIDTLEGRDVVDAWKWLDILTHAYENRLNEEVRI
jgi:hypothetical protein